MTNVSVNIHEAGRRCSQLQSTRHCYLASVYGRKHGWLCFNIRPMRGLALNWRAANLLGLVLGMTGWSIQSSPSFMISFCGSGQL